MMHQNKTLLMVIAMVWIGGFSTPGFSKTTPPTHFFDPAQSLVRPETLSAAGITSSKDPFFDLYSKGAPYSLVAQGKQEQWEIWSVDTPGTLKLNSFGKVDINGTGSTSTGDISAFTFLFGSNTGTWAYRGGVDWIDNPDDEFELYFSIKAGSTRSGGGYNLFVMNEKWYADVKQAVTWSTLENFLVTFETGMDVGLANKELSHIAFWKGSARGGLTDPSVPDQPVPESATLILMGFGLLGIAGVSRRKFQK